MGISELEFVVHYQHTLNELQWNLFIMDTLGPATFWVIFAAIIEGFLYCVLNSESPLREVPLYLQGNSDHSSITHLQ